jgi:hypothetical protein
MFKFELDQLIYYILDDHIHSAPILARMIVENTHDDWARTDKQKRLFTPLGKSRELYATCHSLVRGDEAFASRQDLVNSLLEA